MTDYICAVCGDILQFDRIENGGSSAVEEEVYVCNSCGCEGRVEKDKRSDAVRPLKNVMVV